MRQRLFQDFAPLGTRASAEVEGGGLGLALAARLTALLAGTIGHADSPSGGSVFWLELPLAISGKPSAQSTPVAVSSAQANPAQHLRVLVVDDVAVNREIVESFLGGPNHTVTSVEGGEEAVAAAAIADYDVILMDVSMPEVDGLEATRRIRELMGLCGQVPIVGLTAQAFVQQVVDCREAGMDEHLSKPFSRAALLQAVTGAFEAALIRTGVASPNIVSNGTGWPVFDEAAASEFTACLSPTRITDSLAQIAAEGELLLRQLHQRGTNIGIDDEIVEALHRLAGTAGVFGFSRLAGVSLQLEHAVGTDQAKVPTLVVGVCAAIEATVHDIRRRVRLASVT